MLPRYILAVDELFGISAGMQVYIYPRIAGWFPRTWDSLRELCVSLVQSGSVTEAQTGAQNLPVDPTKILAKLLIRRISM